MKKIFAALVLTSLMASSAYSFDSTFQSTSKDCATDELCMGISHVSTYSLLGLSTTVAGLFVTALSVMLKAENIAAILEQSEINGELTPELTSIVAQIKHDFIKAGKEISEEEILTKLEIFAATAI